MEFTADRSAEPGYRGLVVGLGLSLALHGLLLQWWTPQPLRISERAPRQGSLRLELASAPFAPSAPLAPLAPLAPSASAEAPSRRERNTPESARQPVFNLREDSVAGESPPRRTPRAAPEPMGPRLSRPLDLRLPSDGPGSAPAPDPSASGRIFDERLVQRLEALRSRPRPRTSVDAGNGPLAEISRPSGSGWSTFVQVGKRCFEVIEASPLDELTRDQWYAVDCPP